MKDLISALRGYFPSPTECEKAADELGRKAMQCAVLTVERDELRADLDAERDAAELKSACITGMRQEVTAWSVTAENLEAERDALAADLDKSIALLAMLFDRFENGVQCYEDPEDCTGFIGHAVNLADDEFHACAEILNRLAPIAIKEANHAI